jgi:hypothetical protein
LENEREGRVDLDKKYKEMVCRIAEEGVERNIPPEVGKGEGKEERRGREERSRGSNKI